MTLDLIFASMLALMVFLGWRSGATGQALRVGAAVAVVLLCAPASTLVREAFFEQDTVAAPILEVASMVLAALLIYIGVSLAGWLVIRVMRRTSDTLSALDHWGGATLGTIKAALIIYVLAVCALMLHGPLESIDGDDRLHLRDGRVTTFVARWDILAPWRFRDVDRLSRALRVAAHAQESRRGAEALRERGAAADLVRLETFRALMEREPLVAAARQGSLGPVLADDAARAFLNDDAQIAALRAVDWAAIEADLGLEPQPPATPVAPSAPIEPEDSSPSPE